MRNLLLLFPFLLLWACAGDEAGLQDAGAEGRHPPDHFVGEEAHLAYYDARLAYRDGCLEEALSRARRARALLTAADREDNRQASIQCLHLLAELHFDRAEHMDSVSYYQQAAAELLTPNTPDAVRAEHYLCIALDQLYNYTFTTQITAARLGQELLDSLSPEQSDTYARLLVAEGLGLKKFGDQASDAQKQALWDAAIERMERAVGMFRRSGSLRWREAQREKVIIVSRFRDRARFERSLAPLLAPATAPFFGFPDRLRGYFHHRMGQVDSVLYYYRRFQAEGRGFDWHLQDETYWTLIQYGLKSGDRALAERNVRDQLVLYGCCTEEEHELADAELLQVVRPEMGAYYALCDLGRIRLAEYRATGDTAALGRAGVIFAHILKHWEELFTTGEQESAVNQLGSITHKIVRNANEVAWSRYRQSPGKARAEDLLLTMERTKTFLLLNDRLADADSTAAGGHLDSLRQWQSTLNLLKEREIRHGRLSRPEREQLLNLSQRYRRVMAAARTARRGIYREVEERLPSLRELRGTLQHGAAMLHFAEGDGRLLVQYLDCDTTIAYAGPPTDELSAGVDSLLRMLERPPRRVDLSAYREVAAELFRQLLGPVAKQVTGKRELLVVPAGPVRGLPFGALLRDTTSAVEWAALPYLLNTTAIRYAPSLQIELLNARHRVSDFTRSSLGSWIHPELTAYFLAVTEKWQDRLPAGSHYHTGGECSSASFTAAAESYEVLNLSVHAAGNPYSTTGNYLYFAPGDSLNGAALGRLNYRAALVILTACQTGLGGSTVAEGTFSIARGFQQVGVPDVVYSLWRIPASASASLLDRFYVHLYGGAGAAEALTRAQRELAGGKVRAGRYAFPGSWAGLVKG